MTQPAKAAAEPTMEEILASIRRIIADDDASKTKPADPAPPQPPVAAAPAPAPVPPPAPAPPPPVPPAAQTETEIDALLAELEALPPPLPPAPPPPPERPAPEVLDLTEAMATEVSPPGDGFRTIDGQPDIVFEDRPMEDELPAEQETAMHVNGEDVGYPPRPLMSAQTTAAVDSAFNSLAQTVLVQNAVTLEDLVREMLRPMLKGWLDDNLPALVERLVRAEIDRVSRGRS